ncbi:uncharacterized protein Triagg1_6658 [Trichoderma aggressivum f. europaeum]|uniref:Uncharacterized protein n=1 Tax=Trichoderma aggressivum f. europaeum TaxID=173218 RepID=A0AAE1IB16_9HYPO|nr:hypothetical protein Triagg1_6658 [Trichoderma aggressivum f. europaeum]
MMKPVPTEAAQSETKRNERKFCGYQGIAEAREPPQRPETFDTKHRRQERTITKVLLHSCATRVELEALEGNMIRRMQGSINMTVPLEGIFVFGLGNRVRCNTEWEGVLGSDAGSGYLRAGASDSLGASTGYRAEEQQFGSMGLARGCICRYPTWRLSRIAVLHAIVGAVDTSPGIV